MTRSPRDDDPPGHPLAGPEWMLPARRVLALVVVALVTVVLLSATVMRGDGAGLMGGVDGPPDGRISGAGRPVTG